MRHLVLFAGIAACCVLAAFAPSPAMAASDTTTVYTVQPGDWLSTIAPRYHTSWQAIAAVNRLPNPNLIYPGQRLIIPSAGQAPIAPTTYSPPVSAPSPVPNPGSPGSCVWYVYDQRSDIRGLPSGPYASGFTWAAARVGYRTGSSPAVNAVVVFQPGVQGANGIAGHVAIVRAVYGNGSFLIAEMNGYAGAWHVDERIAWPGTGVSFVY